jgi:deazaflavin-dependent oxidoreductase (nitroreductase family)
MDESEKILTARADAIRQHLRNYVETDGRVGYIQDHTHNGGGRATLHLVLRTLGRKSGRVILVPLVYTPWMDEYVLVASKGGSKNHPDWYLNLADRPDIEFQVGSKRFSGVWRVAQGEERQSLWEYVTTAFTNYAEYQLRTERELPVVVLTITGRIEERWEVAADALANVGRPAEGSTSPQP